MKDKSHSSGIHQLETDLLFSLYRYRRVFYAVGVVLVVAGLGFWIREVYHERLQDQCNQAYHALSTLEEKVDFVDRFHGQPLAGVVALELGHHYYLGANYARAAQLYEKAILASHGTLWEPVARLGQAMSLCASEQTQAALPLLESLAQSSTYPSAVVAEATYQLVWLARTTEDHAALQKWTKHLQEMVSSPAVFYQQKAAALGLM